jgi:hypothetical protein
LNKEGKTSLLKTQISMKRKKQRKFYERSMRNMNYYPNNLYQNYAYSNPTINTQPQISGLQGKVVDGVDMVKATEVMFGGYGVFPKADLSEIYIKN